MKKCNSCKKEKDISCFHKRKASDDGLALICKICQSIYDKGRAFNPERVAARAAYQRTPEGKAAGAKAKSKWAAKNMVKRGANVIVGNALRDGKIIKQPCEVCGNLKVHAHHDDYARPLNVRWLCALHHNKWHEDNGEGING